MEAVDCSERELKPIVCVFSWSLGVIQFLPMMKSMMCTLSVPIRVLHHLVLFAWHLLGKADLSKNTGSNLWLEAFQLYFFACFLQVHIFFHARLAFYSGVALVLAKLTSSLSILHISRGWHAVRSQKRVVITCLCVSVVMLRELKAIIQCCAAT